MTNADVVFSQCQTDWYPDTTVAPASHQLEMRADPHGDCHHDLTYLEQWETTFRLAGRLLTSRREDCEYLPFSTPLWRPVWWLEAFLTGHGLRMLLISPWSCVSTDTHKASLKFLVLPRDDRLSSFDQLLITSIPDLSSFGSFSPISFLCRINFNQVVVDSAAPWRSHFEWTDRNTTGN